MSIEPFDRQLQQLRRLSARLAQQIATLPPSDQPALADTAAALDDALDNLSTQFLQRFELIDYKSFARPGGGEGGGGDRGYDIDNIENGRRNR